MINLISKFKPFSSREEKNTLPELAFDGSNFQDEDKWITQTEDPNNSDFFMVVNRGLQQDCEMIEDHLNNLLQKHLEQFLSSNSEEIINFLIVSRDNRRQERLKSLGYEDLSGDEIDNIKSGRSLI